MAAFHGLKEELKEDAGRIRNHKKLPTENDDWNRQFRSTKCKLRLFTRIEKRETVTDRIFYGTLNKIVNVMMMPFFLVSDNSKPRRVYRRARFLHSKDDYFV